MSSPHQALHLFLQDLEISDALVKKASDQHTYLRTELQKRMATRDNFLSGSYARSTAIRPLNDIDVFVVLDPTQHGGPRGTTPERLLHEVQGVLDELYPNKEQPRLQTRSVNLEFSGTGIAYDVVPAFQDPYKPDVYYVPDRERKTWIPTNPRVHIQASTDANERAGKMLKPLIKAAKHWNYLSDKPLRSFHLEVMACNMLTTKPGSWVEGLSMLFTGLVEAVTRPCPEPARLGPGLDEGVDVPNALRALKDAQALARAAEIAARAGREGEAHHYLRRLLGQDYPEIGAAPMPAPRSAPAIVTSAVDHPRTRHG